MGGVVQVVARAIEGSLGGLRYGDCVRWKLMMVWWVDVHGGGFVDDQIEFVDCYSLICCRRCGRVSAGEYSADEGMQALNVLRLLSSIGECGV